VGVADREQSGLWGLEEIKEVGNKAPPGGGDGRYSIGGAKSFYTLVWVGTYFQGSVEGNSKGKPRKAEVRWIVHRAGHLLHKCPEFI